MLILEKRNFPDLATLYLAQPRPGDSERLVEFVDTVEPGVAKTKKWVMMISTQFGCPVGCRMCDAGSLGYLGNLTAEEILDQIRHIVASNPHLDLRHHPKVKVHLARMGEPALNSHALEALTMLMEEFPYPGIIASVSTIAPKSPAIWPFFEELAAIKDRFYVGGRFQLQFSIHASENATRDNLTGIKKWTLEEIAAYGLRFVKEGDRKVTLNFAFSEEARPQAQTISKIFSPNKFLIKITPVNPTVTADKNKATYLWSEPPGFIGDFAKELKDAGFEVILSPSLPEEIAAATSCGQLWSETLKARAAVIMENQRRDQESYITEDNLKEKSGMWMTSLGNQRKVFSLRPQKAALLVVDMQEFFLNFRSPAYLAPARAVLPNVIKLVESFRQTGRPVFFTTHAHENPETDGGLMALWWKHLCTASSPWSKVLPVFGAQAGEILRKCRYSAFSNRTLEAALREAGVEDLVVAGVMTDLCVESTVRDAFDRGFRTFVAADATASQKEDYHLGALKCLAHGFSQVCLTNDFLSLLSGLPHEMSAVRN